MKTKFSLSVAFGSIWLLVSLFFAVNWAREISNALPVVYVWWVIAGVALLPGFLMSSMFFSNMLHWKTAEYPKTYEDTTVIICAHNEEDSVARSIKSVLLQRYSGSISVLVVDNASSDLTRQEIFRMMPHAGTNRSVRYLFCAEPGKARALNTGLAHVHTTHFITLDADTCLERDAVQRIMDHIVHSGSGCVAGNLFVSNAHASMSAKMQNYDYLLSIAAVKRFQGSYKSTLVAQGAFSAYKTAVVKRLGGWRNVLGEDIVLTYQILREGLASTYEPLAAGYTTVPETLGSLYSQRRRWAIGMLEGLSTVPPWRQGSLFSRFFTWVNVSVIYLDLAFLFGFIPGVIMALCGYYYLAGFLTLFTAATCILLYINMYIYQKKLRIPFENSLCGFVCFLLFFQSIQSCAALHGYLTAVLSTNRSWQ